MPKKQIFPMEAKLYRVVDLANKLRMRNGRLSSNTTPIRTIQDVNKVSFYRSLFMEVCESIIVEEPVLPLDSDLYSVVKTITEFISCNVLNLDLTDFISVEDICAGRPAAIYRFLQLLENLQNCIQNEVERPAPRGKSVLYSPKTSIRQGTLPSVLVKLPKAKRRKVPEKVEKRLIPVHALSSRLDLKKKIARTVATSENCHYEGLKQNPTSYSKTALDRKYELLALKRARLTLENSRKRDRSELMAKVRRIENLRRKNTGLRIKQEALKERRNQQLALSYAEVVKGVEEKVQKELSAAFDTQKPQTVIEKIAALERQRNMR